MLGYWCLTAYRANNPNNPYPNQSTNTLLTMANEDLKKCSIGPCNERVCAHQEMCGDCDEWGRRRYGRLCIYCLILGEIGDDDDYGGEDDFHQIAMNTVEMYEMGFEDYRAGVKVVEVNVVYKDGGVSVYKDGGVLDTLVEIYIQGYNSASKFSEFSLKTEFNVDVSMRLCSRCDELPGFCECYYCENCIPAEQRLCEECEECEGCSPE